jgi:hypothetical protein
VHREREREKERKREEKKERAKQVTNNGGTTEYRRQPTHCS